jgi:hypothetical protein
MRGFTLRLAPALGLSGVDFLRFGMGVGVFSESILGCMALFQLERLDSPREASPSGMGPIEL